MSTPPEQNLPPDEALDLPKRRFVILTLPRSGSYHFASLLGSAPDVTCAGELLKENRVEMPADLAQRSGFAEGDMARRDADPKGFLRTVLAACDTPVFGFKEFETRIARLHLRKDIMYSTGWLKLILHRNPIRKLVSMTRAQTTGAFVKRTDRQRDSDGIVVPFEADRFERLLRTDREFRKTARQLTRRLPDHVRSFDYRDLGKTETLESALAFIGSNGDAAALRSEYRRQNPVPLRDSVEDFDAMARYMTANGHGDLLEDALLPDA